MKYLIFGNGYLGQQFHKYFKGSVMSEVFVKKEEDALREIEKHEPEWVLNCAGITGRPNIDWCEDNKQETFEGNVLLPLMIAKACKKVGVKMLHLGSGCVYSGDNNRKGWSEKDAPNFSGSFYSKTKALSEDMLKDYNVLQLRLRMPIDNDISSERNFIKKITGYKKVIDIKNSMTIVDDLLHVADTLMSRNKTGIYNMVNPGPMSHREILDLYKEMVDSKFNYDIISVDELHKTTKAERSNCVLNMEKLTKEVELKPLKERLTEIFQRTQEK
ncbi:sugar nucleotide-binding protein [Patescibacteria group bacterium]|nr:sugar nucleotide-binding protein [Patescibacteria group bacterium]MBU4512448.1 sugar nucleotide-binding protein [Patescibacteria group bacterium]MCG2692576.1 sugar nucleotide-binding protein [Candidatus Parcubacteria bacterium]